ncbi:hypothetical protein WOSG25_190120 [Weissella oryzae SG25]|uniref:Uncharacterized protein n=1 Tax=Weissella oryzae (strain DSM 25784 / JCM 18191 / LMG 30913 / SG25) TaxID=1329250 RepID=A0A069CWR1_WEIOS|nr:hypothetical protein [Weissella oryzae]GAK31904.1 hypothetical protein WOSG25_190120 [Weissella oryzae SG25]
MNTTSKVPWVMSLMAISISVLLAGLIVNVINNNNVALAKTATAQSEYRQLAKSSSKDTMSAPVIPESTDVSKAKDKVKQFASTYFTYKDAAAYAKRQANLSGTIRLSDADTKSLFAPDDKQAQVDRINNLNLRSEYKSVLSSSAVASNSNNIELVSVVSVKAGSDDLGMKSQKVILHSSYDVNSGYLTNVQINQLI